MSMTFWILIALMLLIAIVLLVYPVLKPRKVVTVAYDESNLSINDGKIKELERDVAEGRINQAAYEEAREELGRELLRDIPGDSNDDEFEASSGVIKKQPVLVVILAVLVPLISTMLYFQLGMPAATDAEFIASQQQPQQPASIEDLTNQLEARIEQTGGSIEDWTMLARAHKYMGDHAQAEKAFTVALEKDQNNAQLMLELAEMMALNNERMFNAEARELVLKAYALEPKDPNALWFIGVSEYQAGNFRPAIDHLLALLPTAGDDENMLKSIISMISRSHTHLVNAGEDVPDFETMLSMSAVAETNMGSAVPAAVTTDVTSASVNVTISIGDEIKNKFNANDAVFIYAKAKQGPRMPLAAHRITLAELPTTVVLDDSMAMVDGLNISSFQQLVISARVTKSGTALAQSGDYIGSQNFTNKNASALVNIVIDTVVP